ncbi:MAG TPA: glycogen debranching N-terminal domain-containing protein [Blastocatellia bacterium]|nr:glycogen debranching N-terminal domain-containing protein [Blastocatellia bacterium]
MSNPPTESPPAPGATREEHELMPAMAAVTRSIAHAVVVKDEDLFFLCQPDGTVPLESNHGFGLYYHDCRYLNGYDIAIGGKQPEHLVWTADGGVKAVLALSNPDIRMLDGRRLDKHSVEIKWERTIDGLRLALLDDVTFNSLTFQPISFSFALTFLASFEDVFAVRGWGQERRGTIQPPRWHGGNLVLAYAGADGVDRRLVVEFSPAPDLTDGATARFDIQLEPKERKQVRVSLLVAQTTNHLPGEPPILTESEFKRAEGSALARRDEWFNDSTEVNTDSLTVNRVMRRSLGDLRMLRSHLGRKEYFAAGVPWFVALFGRDSIITALQTLAYDPTIAEQTLRLLARYQGRALDEWRDEEPGKILHELRVGEMARLNEIPHTPYYGTIDATPLFLILLGRHAAWAGRLDLFDELKENARLALAWIDRYGDLDGDGYVEYEVRSEKGLVNQGWKDSGEAIMNRDGSMARPPIALVEVQGYVYEAKRLMAELFSRAGEAETGDRLRREAETLREKFNRDYWLDEGFYALALQGEDHRPAAVLSSNAGHALWAGIADADKARRTAEHLMRPEMFNGWGIRTLAESELYYNPLGYHLGTVWPHDNSLIAAGLRRYGLDDAAMRVFTGLLDAAVHFDGQRLPELFAGFPRGDYGVPVNYPVACQPQAWAAGTLPYLLKVMLGITPEAFDKRLRVKRPLLPDFVNHVEVKRLRVGAARVDLLFERAASGVGVSVSRVDGELEVTVDS